MNNDARYTRTQREEHFFQLVANASSREMFIDEVRREFGSSLSQCHITQAKLESMYQKAYSEGLEKGRSQFTDSELIETSGRCYACGYLVGYVEGRVEILAILPAVMKENGYSDEQIAEVYSDIWKMNDCN